MLADSFGRIATDLRVSVTDRCNLRTPLRAGADDDQLAAIWRRAVAVKLPGHGINDHGFLQPGLPSRCQPSAADRAARSDQPAEATGHPYP